VDEERKIRRRRLGAKLPTGELHRLGDKLESLVRDCEQAEPLRGPAARRWRWGIDARVARRASRLRGAIEAAGALYLQERLHTVRIAAKKLRYALEVANEAAGVKSSPDVRALKHVQDLLGRLHDRQVLIDRVRQVQASLAPPSLTVWRELEVLVDALEDDCRRLHGRYMHARDSVSALCQRVAGGHKATGARRASA
jgi:CHAD domain-containing protein